MVKEEAGKLSWEKGRTEVYKPGNQMEVSFETIVIRVQVGIFRIESWYRVSEGTKDESPSLPTCIKSN